MRRARTEGFSLTEEGQKLGGSTTTLFKPTKNDVMIGHEFSTDQHSLKKWDNVVLAGGDDSPSRFRLVIS